MTFYHIHKRKRASGKALHPFPANKKSLRILDRVVYTTGLMGIAMMYPQLKLIYIGKDAAGIAPVTWGMLAVFNIPWLIYGIVHKEKPIILFQSLWFVINGLVFIGAMLY